MDGIINIYKEKGYTSHDVVAKARGILQMRKIGHTGTLDPEAEGVLPICIGKATKASEVLINKDKWYRATVTLGVTTTTEDATGEVIKRKEVNLTNKQIQKVVDSFVGDYMQVPPMYSAIKVKGKKLYELARQGVTIERKARPVTIYKCDIIEHISLSEFVMDVKCSKGTYIRTLCADIGETLGCGGHMKDLIRIKVGDFDLSTSISLARLEKLKQTGKLSTCLISPDQVYLDLPKLKAKKSSNKCLYNGNKLTEDMMVEKIQLDLHRQVRIYDANDVFVGIYHIETINNKYYFKVDKMFLPNNI